MAGHGENQMALLAALYASPMGGVGMAALMDATGIVRVQISHSIGSLVMRGLVVRLERGLYQITPEGIDFHEGGERITCGHIHPLTGTREIKSRLTLRQKAWTVMRMGDVFDVDGLASVASDASDRKPRINLRRYVKALLDAGYLDVVPTERRIKVSNRKGFKRYRLARNTGETAPVHKWRSNPPVMWDHNQKRGYPIQTASDQEAA